MTRIYGFITCIILIISAHCSCLASKHSTKNNNMAQQSKNEISIPVGEGGTSRLRLGIDLEIMQCAHVGNECYITRDANPPRNVKIQPCCDYLICTGTGAHQIGVNAPNNDAIVGICTLSLDNDQAIKDRPKYASYVKSQ